MIFTALLLAPPPRKVDPRYWNLHLASSLDVLLSRWYRGTQSMTCWRSSPYSNDSLQFSISSSAPTFSIFASAMPWPSLGMSAVHGNRKQEWAGHCCILISTLNGVVFPAAQLTIFSLSCTYDTYFLLKLFFLSYKTIPLLLELDHKLSKGHWIRRTLSFVLFWTFPQLFLLGMKPDFS